MNLSFLSSRYYDTIRYGVWYGGMVGYGTVGMLEQRTFETKRQSNQ